jgi:hypothetical protein
MCSKLRVPPTLYSGLGFKFNIYHNKLWVEQFLRIELQPKWKEASGKYSCPSQYFQHRKL